MRVVCGSEWYCSMLVFQCEKVYDCDKIIVIVFFDLKFLVFFF